MLQRWGRRMRERQRNGPNKRDMRQREEEKENIKKKI